MSHGTCPCCEERVVFHPGYNDLLTVVPDAALDIRAEDNPEIDIHAIPLYGYPEIVGDPLYDPNRHTMLMEVKWDEDGKPVFRYENNIH